MLIFYVKISSVTVRPVVIIDAMSSDDRFTEKEINFIAGENIPSIFEGSYYLNTPVIFSCEYSAQFEHIGMPLGSMIKTRFSGILKSPPGLLVDIFSPKFLTDSRSVQELSDNLSTIPNAQTHITYAAMIFKTQSGGTVSRKFIVYAAPMFPDPYGTTITMNLSGAMIDDVMIKTTTFCQIDKKSTLKEQLDTLLSSQSPAYVGDYTNAPAFIDSIPATEILLKPMTFFNLISEICLQNKLIPSFDFAKQKISFYGQGNENAPKNFDATPPKFSFLGSNGAIAWGLGIENYSNLKFKTSIFDCQLFTKVIIYNDINSAIFGGLTKNPSPAVASMLSKIPDSYDAFIIRYVMRWNRQETVCEVTASNNWLMAQFRVDNLLESAIYANAALNL